MGGIFIDADSICVEKIDNLLLNIQGFISYENEIVRPGLVAVGTMGFVPNHPLCKEALDKISVTNLIGQRAWKTTGPVLLTQIINTKKYPELSLKIYPSYFFQPVHYTGETYKRHGKIYSYQFWGSTKQNYNEITLLPCEENKYLENPKIWISLLISCYNTNLIYVKECLQSIKNQIGDFGIEIVWINDGSEDYYSKNLEKLLDEFIITTRFCKIIYKKMKKNYGLSYCLNKGVYLCNNDLIFRMDSDDIMNPYRIQKQIDYMQKNPECMLCGTDLVYFTDGVNGVNGEKKFISRTIHPTLLTWETYKTSCSLWILNHPTLCFRKEAILEVGNYNKSNKDFFEDLELELKILKKYGSVHNIPEMLLEYRIHPEQITYGGKANTQKYIELKNQFIESLLCQT